MFKQCICLGILCLLFQSVSFAQRLSVDDVLKLYERRYDFHTSIGIGLSHDLKYGEVDSTHLLMISHREDQPDSTFEKFVTMRDNDGVVYFVWKRTIYESWGKELLKRGFEYHGLEQGEFDSEVYYKKGMWVSLVIDKSENDPCYILQILTETKDDR